MFSSNTSIRKVAKYALLIVLFYENRNSAFFNTFRVCWNNTIMGQLKEFRYSSYKILQSASHRQRRGLAYSARVVKYWYKFPASVVTAPSVNVFKKGLEKVWTEVFPIPSKDWTLISQLPCSLPIPPAHHPLTALISICCPNPCSIYVVSSRIIHRCKLSYFHKICVFNYGSVLTYAKKASFTLFEKCSFLNDAILGYSRKVLQFHVFPLFNSTHKEISCCKVCFKTAPCWNRTTFQDETRVKIF